VYPLGGSLARGVERLFGVSPSAIGPSTSARSSPPKWPKTLTDERPASTTATGSERLSPFSLLAPEEAYQ
jgi:hypothetical protein